jgi:hypothetical protein
MTPEEFQKLRPGEPIRNLRTGNPWIVVTPYDEHGSIQVRLATGTVGRAPVEFSGEPGDWSRISE